MADKGRDKAPRRIWVRIVLALLVLVVLVGVAAAGAGYWLYKWSITSYGLGSYDGELVRIPRGASGKAIAAVLHGRGVIKSELPFLLLGRLSGKGQELKAGTYRFTECRSPQEVLPSPSESCPCRLLR